MEDNIDILLSHCSGIDFGDICFSNHQKQFYREWNDDILSFFKSMPESTRTETSLFLMRYLRTSLDKDFNLLKYFYTPASSIIYWLVYPDFNGTSFEKEVIKNARTAHFLSMLLHLIDDHLCDGELPITHFTLLLRSQSWMIMNSTLAKLIEEIDGGGKLVEDFINNYYSGLRHSEEIESLSDYCDIFRKQMAIVLIVPILMSKMATKNLEFTRAIHDAGCSFGIAWRLLDDIKDIEEDMVRGVHSSIYMCLPSHLQYSWDEDIGEGLTRTSEGSRTILRFIMENGVIERIMERICIEIYSAVTIAENYGMSGLAAEFRNMISPIKNGCKP